MLKFLINNINKYIYMKSIKGQNFLIDKIIIEKFINLINPKCNENFIELGSGTGNITKSIINFVKNIILIEIDNKLYKILLKKFDKHKNIFILKKDARFINIKKLNIFNKNFRIFGSIPYYATIPIITNLFKYINYISDIHFIVQKEMSDRISSKLGSKNYCKLNIILNLFFNSYKIYDNINPKSFFPIPKVNSSIIKLIPKTKRINMSNDEFINFRNILKYSFSEKRKMIKNNLSNILNIDDIKKICNPSCRAQNISVNQYYKLSKLL